MLVRRTLATALVAPLLVFAGCQADDPQPRMPSPTASPTTSATSETPPKVDPLAIPAAATKPNKAGAKAAVRHFWDMVNHLVATGDADPARAVFESSCDFCEAGVSSYESIVADGHTFSGGAQSVVKVKASLLGSLTNSKDAYADVTVESTPQIELDSQGETVNEIPAGSSRKGYFLTYLDGHWTITNVGEPER